MAYGIFAMALAFIWGQAGILSFGQAIFFGIGGYCMGLVTLGQLPLVGDSTFAGLLLALARTRLGGRLFCHRYPVRGRHRRDTRGGFNGLLGIPPFLVPWRTEADAYLTPTEIYFLMLAASLVVYLVLSYIIWSPVGTVLAAIRDNDQRTAFFGYNIVSYKVGAFVVSALVSGLAGALFVKQFGFAAPSLIGFGLSAEVLIWVAVGGRNVLLAAFLGALLVRSVEGELSDRLGDYWLLALGMLFVLTVVLMPTGLFGRILMPPVPKRLHSARPGG